MPDPILTDVATATNLREGPAGVEAVVREIVRAGNIRLADAARGARLPLPVATAIRRELEKRGLLQRDHGLALSETGQRWARDELGLGEPLQLHIPLRPTHPLPSQLHLAESTLQDLLTAAPAADVTLDQAPCTAETAIRRAALLYQCGGLEGRRVLLIGDDDSVSVACALLGKLVASRPLARRIMVLDIDPKRLSFIRDCASRHGVEIETLQHDLRQTLPAELSGAFDTFITDPPYTLEGAKLFLTRGIEGIEAGRGQAMFSFGHTAPSQRIALQATMAELGLAITALHPGFNSYSGAAILGATSELYELQVHAMAKASEAWTGPLYTAEANPKQSQYRCLSCSRKWTLGLKSVPATISELKEKGCPQCGAKKFDRVTGKKTRDNTFILRT